MMGVYGAVHALLCSIANADRESHLAAVWLAAKVAADSTWQVAPWEKIN